MTHFSSLAYITYYTSRLTFTGTRTSNLYKWLSNLCTNLVIIVPGRAPSLVFSTQKPRNCRAYGICCTKMADLEQQLYHLKLPVVTRTRKEESIGVGSYASVYEVMVHGTVCAAKEMHPVPAHE